jgi:Domain of unknown function (DUF4174)
MCFMLLTSVLFSWDVSAPDISKREIILLAEHTMDPDLLQQEKILQADAGGLAERDIVVTLITPISDKNRYDQLRKNKKGFLFILIGKDGGEKLNSKIPVTLEQLFGLIDTMPMRRYEIETRSPQD